MCFPPWNSALHHAQKVTPTLNAHGTPMISCSNLWKGKSRICKNTMERKTHHTRKNQNSELLLSRDSWGFTIVNATILSSWATSLILWVPFLDYGTKGFSFCRFCFHALHCKLQGGLHAQFSANKTRLERDPTSFERDPGTPNTLTYARIGQANQAKQSKANQAVCVP